MVESITARYDQSVDHLEQALALARVVGAVTQETSALQRMAIAELGRGDVDAALRRARQAADVSTRSLSALETAQARALGYAAGAAGLWQEARPAFAAAAEVTDTLELPTLAREARAGLAGVERSEGDLEAAVALVRAVVPHLDVKGLEGSVSPGRVLLTCWQVLDAAGDPGARDVVGRAHTYLRARAAAVGDDELARQYLEVPVHAALLATAL